MSDSSDDEYAPIEATTWGSQTPTQPNNQSEEPKGWDSLLDPAVKVGPNDVGSGNLHRRGTNFKPIGEDLILAQRLNKPVGKKKMQEAIRETELSLGLPLGKDKSQRSKKKNHSDNNTNTSRKFSHQTTTSSTTNRQPRPSNHVEVPSTTRMPKLSDNHADGGGSNWLQSSLVDTPFWNEKKGGNSSKPFDLGPNTTIQKPPSSQPDNNFNRTTTSPVTMNNDNAPNASITNGRNAIQNKYKVDINANNVWTKGAVKSEKDMKDSWGAIAKDIEPFTNTGWDVEGEKSEAATRNAEEDNQWGSSQSTSAVTSTSTAEWEHKNDGWASGFDNGTNLSGWGLESSSNNDGWGQSTNEVDSNSNSVLPTKPSWMNSTDSSNNNTIPSSKPSWMNSAPTPDNYNNSPTQNSGSRFSNPSKQRYSGSLPMNVPKPSNYRPNASQTIPLATAPPPPPENSLLVKINVELSDTVKISVDIHELDEPLQLAKTFANNNNIQNEKVISALCNLFSKQKNTAIEKKKQKLQRRVFSSQPKPRYYNQNNVYTNSSSYQYPSAPTSPNPPPFTRKAYY